MVSVAKELFGDSCVVVVDNTFMSPYNCNPLRLGADLVVHSATKYLNGHSDVVQGVVVGNSPALCAKLRHVQNSIGAVPSPFDCYLVMRGIKTLAVRMERHGSNALGVARYLEAHEGVERVLYPGLESHPQHELAKAQCSGFGGIVTFYLRGGLAEARTFLESVELFTLGESLGAVESLIESPAIMTHASVPVETRLELGLTDNLVRISVGLEDIEALLEDLAQALGKAAAARS